MRPQSEIRVTLAAALVDGPGTTRQLAQRTGWAIGDTRRALDNMVTAGDACKPRSVRMPGVKRPVPVYARAMRAVDAAAGDGAPGVDLIMAWAGLAAPAAVQPMEAAM
jgi:hypothetical protein